MYVPCSLFASLHHILSSWKAFWNLICFPRLFLSYNAMLDFCECFLYYDRYEHLINALKISILALGSKDKK